MGAVVITIGLLLGIFGVAYLLEQNQSPPSPVNQADGATTPVDTGGSTPVNTSLTDLGDVIGTALPIIEKFEGFSAIAYEDPPGSGKFTIGYGHQIQPGESFGEITPLQAEEILNKDVTYSWGCVQKSVTVPLNTNQAAALTSLCYNIGCTAFKNSTLLRDLNAGDYTAAAAQFGRWDMAGGAVNSNLAARRQQEMDLFNA